jgi:hypothetical protein
MIGEVRALGKSFFSVGVELLLVRLYNGFKPTKESTCAAAS